MKATYDVDKAHSIYASDGRKVFTFWNDARWMDPIEMKAGGKEKKALSGTYLKTCQNIFRIGICT